MNNRYIYTYTIFFWSLIILSAQSQNSQALLSTIAKEERIQNAVELRSAQQYTEAADQLEYILETNPNDAPILLFKGDILLQSKNYADAVDTYEKLLELDYEKTITEINLSYALFMDHRPIKALVHAKTAFQNDTNNPNAIVNYFNALLWNVSTTEAEQILNAHDSLLSRDQILVMKARLHTTSGHYKKGLMYYEQLVNEYSNKHYAQEYVEVLIGKKEITRAEKAFIKQNNLWSANEKIVISDKIKAAKTQYLGAQFTYFKDVASNIRTEKSIHWLQGQGKKYILGINATIADQTSINQEKSRSSSFGISIHENWNQAWSGQTKVNFQNLVFPEQDDFMAFTGEQSIKYQPTDRRMIGIFYKSDILNFTPSLLKKNIRSHNLGYLTHLMFGAKTGFYSEGSWGSISDNNKRWQFFGSLFHIFRNQQPLIKAGINLSALHFNDNSITNYFSPNKYLNTELFAEYNTNLFGQSRYFLKTQAAIGMQKTEKNEWNKAFRFDAQLSMRVKHLESSIKYSNSNVASGNGTGYKYGQLSFSLFYKW